MRPFGKVGKEKTKTSAKENHYSELNLLQLSKAGEKNIYRREQWKAIQTGFYTETVRFYLQPLGFEPGGLANCV